MSRNFGLTNGGSAVPSHPLRSPGTTQNLRADNVVFLPARVLPGVRRTTDGRLAARPSYSAAPRHWALQLLIDCAAVAAGVVFALVGAVSILASVVMLFVCRF